MRGIPTAALSLLAVAALFAGCGPDGRTELLVEPQLAHVPGNQGHGLVILHPADGSTVPARRIDVTALVRAGSGGLGWESGDRIRVSVQGEPMVDGGEVVTAVLEVTLGTRGVGGTGTTVGENGDLRVEILRPTDGSKVSDRFTVNAAPTGFPAGSVRVHVALRKLPAGESVNAMSFVEAS